MRSSGCTVFTRRLKIDFFDRMMTATAYHAHNEHLKGGVSWRNKRPFLIGDW